MRGSTPSVSLPPPQPSQYTSCKGLFYADIYYVVQKLQQAKIGTNRLQTLRAVPLWPQLPRLRAHLMKM